MAFSANQFVTDNLNIAVQAWDPFLLRESGTISIWLNLSRILIICILWGFVCDMAYPLQNGVISNLYAFACGCVSKTATQF